MKERKTTVYFVRHAEAEPKIEGIINYNPKLTKKGNIQSKSLGKKIANLSQKPKIYASNLLRAKKTSEILNRRIKIKIIELKEFRELNRYFFENKIWNPKWWKYYFSYRKACKMFDKILEENMGKALIFVIHGRRIISLVGYKLGLSIKQMEKMISMGNCNVSRLVFEGKNLKKINYLNAEFRE